MTIHTIADIMPNGTAAVTTNSNILATWVQVTATGTSIRYGDASVGAAQGAKIPAGELYDIIPRDSFDQARLDLSTLYFYGSGSDSVSITWGD